MRFMIADTFTQSLGKLTPQEQTLVKGKVFDFQVNPANPGHSLHKLEKSRDKNFWSVYLNMDLRLIVYRAQGDFIMVYTDHHDAAYRWVENRVMKVHPTTGAAQMLEIQEQHEKIYKAVYEEVSKKPLFAKYPHDYLLAMGVPEEYLPTLEFVDENDFLDLIDKLPQEAAENLMKLTQGQVLPLPVATKAVDPFLHPDAQRRFKIVDDDKGLLERALSSPWSQWIVFLHPSQGEVAERTYNGPARVSGGAGTGKTVVALHRVARLASKGSDGRILLTTFSKTLASRLRHNLRLLMGEAAEGVEVKHLHALAVELWHGFGERFTALPEEVLKEALETAERAVGSGFSMGFIRSEWESIIDAEGITDWATYSKVPRTGRGTPLGARQRLKLWGVFERVGARLEEGGFMTFSRLCHETAKRLDAANKRPFAHAVADEIQDFGPAELRLLRALTLHGDDDLFLAGDMGQRIYKGKSSFKACGVDLLGRASTLRLNYRTTEQIRRYADGLLPAAISDGDGNNESRETVSLLSGPEPAMSRFPTPNDEIEGVVNMLESLLHRGYGAGDIAIFCRTNGLLRDRAHYVAARLNLEPHYLSDDEPLAPDCIALGTMHRAKGLEFKVVVVMACEEPYVPLARTMQGLIDEAERTGFLEQEKHLLYVACTRARERLLVTAAGSLSPFLSGA